MSGIKSSNSRSRAKSRSFYDGGLTSQIVSQWKNERPDLDLTAFLIGIQIGRLSILGDRQGNMITSKFGLRFGEMMVLYALRRRGLPFELRPTDLFSLLSVSSSTMTYRLDKLERLGFLERAPDPEDRRGFIIRLTKKGCSTVDKAVTEAATSSQTMLRKIYKSKQDIKALAELLAVLAEGWERELGNS